MQFGTERSDRVGALSDAAKSRLLSSRGEPLFIASWERVLMIHFEVDAPDLQACVPFELDLWDNRAFLSLVAFTMRGMRPRRGGWLSRWLLKPIATHAFLNVRTYVRGREESGIHFLAEWLSNPLAVRFGPGTFGLPYRYGRIHYQHGRTEATLHGCVEDGKTGSALSYRATPTRDSALGLCEPGSLTEWLMERYTAFTRRGTKPHLFRVWHPPWAQQALTAELSGDVLLRENWPWFAHARVVGANYSPGFDEVWMGRPHRLRSP
jgi:uncharacterized protein